MVTGTPTDGKRKRKIFHKGLNAAAKELKVHRNHLHLVLMGHRKSPPLIARYEALTGKPHVFPAPTTPTITDKGPNP